MRGRSSRKTAPPPLGRYPRFTRERGGAITGWAPVRWFVIRASRRRRVSRRRAVGKLARRLKTVIRDDRALKNIWEFGGAISGLPPRSGGSRDGSFSGTLPARSRASAPEGREETCSLNRRAAS